eukprot:1387883-Amphidinium_carterae.1
MFIGSYTSPCMDYVRLPRIGVNFATASSSVCGLRIVEKGSDVSSVVSDLACVVGIMGSAWHKAPYLVTQCAHRLWRHLAGCVELSICTLPFSGAGPTRLGVAVDASFAPDGDRSRTGAVAHMENAVTHKAIREHAANDDPYQGVVFWSSQRQRVTAVSACFHVENSSHVFKVGTRYAQVFMVEAFSPDYDPSHISEPVDGGGENGDEVDAESDGDDAVAASVAPPPTLAEMREDCLRYKFPDGMPRVWRREFVADLMMQVRPDCQELGIDCEHVLPERSSVGHASCTPWE